MNTSTNERKRIMNTKTHNVNALAEAMDKQIPFSWSKKIKNKNTAGKVQKGVYICHSQSFFQTYEMKK